MLQTRCGHRDPSVPKDHIQHVYTHAARYVPGLDCTLIKSRSGANAIATWMVLQTHGFAGGVAFCRDLMDRTERLWLRLNELGVGCYRHGRMNVVALDAPAALADRWLLAPDAHHSEARWRKTVMLEHVNWERLEEFLEELAGRVKS